jgi:hypothetical protein
MSQSRSPMLVSTLCGTQPVVTEGIHIQGLNSLVDELLLVNESSRTLVVGIHLVMALPSWVFGK